MFSVCIYIYIYIYIYVHVSLTSFVLICAQLCNTHALPLKEW